MANKRVSIFAGGYLGTRLANRLNSEKYSVSVSYRTNAPKGTDEGVNVCQVFVEEGQLKGDKSLFDCDTLVICIPPGFKKGMADFYPANILSVVEQALTSRVEHIIFTSSVGIYTEARIIDESQPIDTSQYKSKVLSDAESSVLDSRVKFKHVLRLAGLIGDGRTPGAFRLMITEDNASSVVNMILIEDVVAAIQVLIGTPQTNHQIYNLVAPHHPNKQTFFRHARISEQRPNGAICDVTPGLSKQVRGDLIELDTGFAYRHRNLFTALTELG